MSTYSDTYLVVDLEDRLHASLCYGEEEAREVFEAWPQPANLRVYRTTIGELARNVTGDFIPDEDAIAEEIRHNEYEARAWQRHCDSLRSMR